MGVPCSEVHCGGCGQTVIEDKDIKVIEDKDIKDIKVQINK